jgi:hypothetical protein
MARRESQALPVVVCDARTVEPRSLPEVDGYGYGYGYGAENYSWHNIGSETCGVSADDKQSWYYYPVMTLDDVLVIKSYDADGVIGTTCPRASTDAASIFRILTELFLIQSYNPSDQIITFRDVNERRINKTRKRRRLRRCICSSCSSGASGTGHYLLAIGYAHQLGAGPVRLGAASVISSRQRQV